MRSSASSATCFLVAIFLSGCATQEQLAKQCSDYGFRPGTDNHAQCVMNLEAQAYQRGAAAQQILLQTRPKTCYTFGATQTCY